MGSVKLSAIRRAVRAFRSSLWTSGRCRAFGSLRRSCGFGSTYRRRVISDRRKGHALAVVAVTPTEEANRHTALDRLEAVERPRKRLRRVFGHGDAFRVLVAVRDFFSHQQRFSDEI